MFRLKQNSHIDSETVNGRDQMETGEFSTEVRARLWKIAAYEQWPIGTTLTTIDFRFAEPSKNCYFSPTPTVVVSYQGMVNPAALQAGQHVLLDRIISKQKSAAFIQAGAYYLPTTLANVTYEFVVLTHNLCRLGKEDRYHIIGGDEHTLVGSGSTAKVLDVAGTYKKRFSLFGENVFSPHQEKLVVKCVDKHKDLYPTAFVVLSTTEAAAIKATNPSYFKHCMIHGSGPDYPTRSCHALDYQRKPEELFAVIAMRKIVGFSFDIYTSRRFFPEYRQHVATKGKPLTVEQENENFLLSTAGCFWATRQVILALIDHHAAGYLHGDVKPDNLLIEWTRARRKVKIVDQGYARKPNDEFYHEHVGGISGTPLYLSPEYASANLYNDKTITNDVLGDDYAMSIVIGMVWGDTAIDEHPYNNSVVKLYLDRQQADPLKFTLFQDADYVHEKILAILNKLTPNARAKRISMLDALAQFETARRSYFCSQTKLNIVRFAIVHNHQLALTQDLRFRHLSVAELPTEGPAYAKWLTDELIAVVNQLYDYPLAINIFTQTFDMGDMLNVPTKAMLLAKIETHYQTYLSNYELFEARYQELIDIRCYLQGEPNFTAEMAETEKKLLACLDYAVKAFNKTKERRGDLSVLIDESDRLARKAGDFAEVIKELKLPLGKLEQRAKMRF